MPTFTSTRTVTVERVCVDDELGLLRLLRELNTSDWKQHVQRVTVKVDLRHFTAMFKNTKTKEDIDRLWVSNVTEGNLSFRTIEENPTRSTLLNWTTCQRRYPPEQCMRTSANMLSARKSESQLGHWDSGTCFWFMLSIYWLVGTIICSNVWIVGA